MAVVPRSRLRRKVTEWFTSFIFCSVCDRVSHWYYDKTHWYDYWYMYILSWISEVCLLVNSSLQFQGEFSIVKLTVFAVIVLFVYFAEDCMYMYLKIHGLTVSWCWCGLAIWYSLLLIFFEFISFRLVHIMQIVILMNIWLTSWRVIQSLFMYLISI